MPGILPMKVIKVGTSSQSRIAQACDRCRSKKIRCDGIRPTCSQCSNVGFECKTSDKLSRRAFPRGYTESLEERVRQLESEVRELKDLLDEKDEKIDMLSKMHAHRQASGRSSASPNPIAQQARDASPPEKQDSFRVQATSLLLGVENSDSYFMGSSSGRAFIETFKRRVQENGKPCGDFNLEAFLHAQGCYSLVETSPSQSLRVPPRIFSDRCVNIYFQEWAPLFPVLHKPTFLQIYEEFASDPDKIKNNHKLAQLYLVFSIASLSSEMQDLEQIAACELQWQKALDAIMFDNTMYTLQCLVLALMYCTIRADYKRLQLYKAVAVALSHRLGLHQSQKRFSFGALTIETRKKVFWTLYSLDCFSAAILGLPKLLREDDIYAEYPSDADDEYVTEKGFQPTLPGEHTRISSALALFKLSRILARVLEEIYPAASSHELSLQQMSTLDAELQAWDEALPAHLRLIFAQDKPSADITGSRSPILALAYYHVRVLIHRPAVGSSLGAKAASALLTAVDSSKHIIQIVQLLEERSMSFSFCLNKTDVLVLCAMTLLYQSLGLKLDSKLMKDIEKLISAVLGILQKTRAAGFADLKKIAKMLIMVSESPQPEPMQMETSSGTTMPVLSNTSTSSTTRKSQVGRHIGAASSEPNLLSQHERLRRMTIPGSSTMPRTERSRTQSRASFVHPHIEHSHSNAHHNCDSPNLSHIQQTMIRVSHPQRAKPNMDYLSVGNGVMPNHHQSPSPNQDRMPSMQPPPITTSQHPQNLYSTLPIINKDVSENGIPLQEWEALLIGAMDSDQINVYDTIYGATALPVEPTTMPTTTTATSAAATYANWIPDPCDLSGFSIGDLNLSANAAGAQSVPSVSDESLSSADDASNERYISGMNGEDHSTNGSTMARRNGHDGSLALEGLNGSLRI